MFARQDSGIHSQTAAIRVILALVIPVALAALVAPLVVTRFALDPSSGRAQTAVVLGSVALGSWLLGVAWYGSRGMGMRGGRSLTAGIGFAVLGWVIFLILRLILVEIAGLRAPDSGRTFFYLLIFEALATQLWAFGLFFHSVADWRGGLTAVVASGILFGLVAVLLFQESAFASPFSILFYAVWGILLALIRLRTGSLLGITLVQALQSYTAWVVLFPPSDPAVNQLTYLYAAASAVFLIVIWRLWPKSAEDYQI